MPLVYLNGEIKETDKTEEELQKSGLEPIKTQKGTVWAASEDRLKVFKECGPPSLGPKFPPPPNSGGPPPPPSQLGMMGGPPPPSVEVKKVAPVKREEPPTMDNKSSAVPTEQMNAFVEGLVKKSGQLGFPVYSVCDNNSFHTSGYLWGYYAARMVEELNMPLGPIAVVNFDSHQDAGKAGHRVVASDRWGEMLIEAMNKRGFPACYLSAFNRPDTFGKTGFYFGSYPRSGLKAPKSVVPKNNDEKYAEKMETIRKDYRDFWKSVTEHFEQPIKYVFFTIDRDVLNDSYTQWGNGAINGTRQLLQLMEAVLEPLNVMRNADGPQARLIGFDITGLPESRRYQNFMPSSGTFGEPKVVWSNLSQELYAVLDFAHSRLLDARRSIYVPHVLFFSGSISYTSRDGDESKDWDCWDYVSYLSDRLRLLLACTNVYYQKGWSYMLCQQATQIYESGWKRFTLYKPEKALKPGKRDEVKEALGEGTPLGGFACTAGVSDFDRLDPSIRKVKFDDMVKMIDMFAPPQ
jgi:hypothetical protein